MAFRLKKSNRKTFSGWRIQTEKCFLVKEFQPKNVFRFDFFNRKTFSGLKFSTGKRFSVGILQPGNAFRLEFFNRETLFGWNSSTEKRFSVRILQSENVFRFEFFNRKTFFGSNSSTGKRFSVRILQPESGFRFESFNWKVVFNYANSYLSLVRSLFGYAFKNTTILKNFLWLSKIKYNLKNFMMIKQNFFLTYICIIRDPSFISNFTNLFLYFYCIFVNLSEIQILKVTSAITAANLEPWAPLSQHIERGKCIHGFIN